MLDFDGRLWRQILMNEKKEFYVRFAVKYCIVDAKCLMVGFEGRFYVRIWGRLWRSTVKSTVKVYRQILPSVTVDFDSLPSKSTVEVYRQSDGRLWRSKVKVYRQSLPAKSTRKVYRGNLKIHSSSSSSLPFYIHCVRARHGLDSTTLIVQWTVKVYSHIS